MVDQTIEVFTTKDKSLIDKLPSVCTDYTSQIILPCIEAEHGNVLVNVPEPVQNEKVEEEALFDDKDIPSFGTSDDEY